MRRRGEGELAQLFRFLADVEDKHSVQVAARAPVHPVAEPPPSMRDSGLPDDFDDEVATSATLTPYRALALAVRHEESSFAFYSYLAAEATSDSVRQLAEALAKDELDHAALLRIKRRRAYRTERATAPREAMPETVAELRALASRHALSDARLHRALAARLALEGQQVAAEAFSAAAGDEDAEAGAAFGVETSQEGAAGVPPTVTGGLRVLEEAFERYTAIVERASDEAVLGEAQHLSERALRRLALTRGRLVGASAQD
jgi:rubrerythrin